MIGLFALKAMFSLLNYTMFSEEINDKVSGKILHHGKANKQKRFENCSLDVDCCCQLKYTVAEWKIFISVTPLESFLWVQG